ncbi:hypothetical protein GRX03_06780 [Halovenus sp. WSH3]|uniref:Uncharacterized protein n=1 Tax=Halovenus carboxidivorans TaxID=2692199 RepID=A0A6B0TDN8_9EURY|nr:hypothetical protein [Halovenus carboxidivorans]MXR51309.1 hypothetical protein [Halovenus carboxidivorans]
MYCVYMSTEHLEEEPVEELYGDFIDENYQWRPSATEETDTDSGPEFLNDERDADVDLMTGEGSDR